jgi:hypothetical protein
MPETKRLIVDLSSLPCSIIIVGVGNADFYSMKQLDGDDGILKDGIGRRVERDVVQFVEFNKSVLHGNLAEEVLKEIPNQLCGYMEHIGYVPQPIQQAVPVVVEQTATR